MTVSINKHNGSSRRTILPLASVAGLSLLLGACEGESEPFDDELELVEAAAEPDVVAVPLSPEDQQRLEIHGQLPVQPTARSVADVPPAELELGLPAAEVERHRAQWDGHETLFARVRTDDGISTNIVGEARSQLLEEATIDPMDMNLEVVAAQTNLDLHVDVRVELDGQTGERRITERLLYTGEHPAPRGPSTWEEAPSHTELSRMVDAELGGTDAPVVLDDGRLLVYAAFTPKLPWDTAHRVAWLSPQHSREQAVLVAEAERKAEVAELLARSLVQLDDLGLCSLVHPSPVQNAAWVACSEDELRRLAERGTGLVRALDVIGMGTPDGVDGQEVRANTGSQAQIAISAGYSGWHGTGGRPAIEVALLDGAGFYRGNQHPGYDDWLDGPSRITSIMTCSTSSCWTDTINGSAFAHGAVAMLGAFSDLTQGQDASVTTTSAREERSHGAYEAEIEAYRWEPGGGEPGLIRAADPSVDGGVDMAAISWGNNDCGNELAYTAWRDAWDYAYSQGVFGIISAGNFVNRLNDNCTANGWASRPDMLMVGAFGDWGVPLANWAYDTEQIMGGAVTNLGNNPNCAGTDASCLHSSYGGANLRFSSGSIIRARSTVDITMPSGREFGAHMNGSASPIYDTQCCGTSMAAPSAAAAAVTFKDWAIADGQTIFNDPGFMHIAMLLMGDGTGSGTNPNPGGAPTSSTSGMNWIWGAGRMKMRIWNEVGLDAPWAWGVGAFYMYHGDTIDVPIGGGPFPSAVDAWTGAFSWNEPWINANDTSKAAADIVFSVVTTNPVGGVCANPMGSGSVTTVTGDYSFDPTKRIRLRPGTISQLHNKCAWMRFKAYSIPADQNGYTRRWVYRADMWEDLAREPGENLTNIE
jgi:hypothetical protein